MKCLCFILGILVVFSAGFLFTGCEKQKASEKNRQATQISKNLTVPAENKTTQQDDQNATKVEIKVPQTAEPNEGTGDSQKTGPVIKFESTTHNFGNIQPKSINRCKFKFKNAGDGILEIKKIRSTCGCTVPDLKKKKYAPGESGEINVSFRAGISTGPTQKHLYVLSNDKKHPSVTLTIKATIAKVVDYKPEILNLSLKKGNAGCPEITIQSLDGKEFSITQFKSSPDCIVADFDPSRKATKLVLKPQVDLQKLKQYLNGTVRIYLDHPDCSLVTIRFSTPPEFKTRPPTILIFEAEPNKPVVREGVWLLNNYNEDFEIESTSSKQGFVKVVSSQKVDKSRHKFKLEITPPEQQGNEKSFNDDFIIKIKGGQQVKISCRGFYLRK